jgi:hypothetical protein
VTFERGKNNDKRITDNCLLDFLVATREAAENREFYSISQERLCLRTPCQPQLGGTSRGPILVSFTRGRHYPGRYRARQTNVSFSFVSNAEACEHSNKR